MGGPADFVRGRAARLFRAIPEAWRLRLFPGVSGYSHDDVPAVLQPPEGDLRLLIGHSNSAGQGWHWARAASRLGGVGAVNLQVRGREDVFRFPASATVPVDVFRKSDRWARAQFDAVAEGFTHVLFESVRPMFGSLFGGDVEAEVAALRARGVRVGMIVHGSDVRLPSVHRARNPWSPFHHEQAERVATLERAARTSRDKLARIGAPIFASTTSLALEIPGAVWLPVVVDPAAWAYEQPPFGAPTPVVLHVPSSDVMKGTTQVRAAVAPLVEEGLVDYREAHGVASSEMAGLYRAADIVIDGVRMGNYGVGACEAMAAGRLTFAHLSPAALQQAERIDVRAPLIATDPGRLEVDLRTALADRTAAGALAARGPAFVRAVHDGRRSAQVLAGFLGAE